MTAPNPFEYQKPSDDMVERIREVRTACEHAYVVLMAEVPECAERTLAVRKLEEVSMWANKAIVFKGQRYL